MNSPLKLVTFILTAGFTALVLGVTILAGAYLYLAPQLPAIESLRDVQLQEPLRVYTQAGELIAEFGEVKRIPIEFSAVPKPMVQAILAAEDDRFYQHPGVDYQGLLRAAVNLLQTGEKTQGGSTITMQVARNFFLSSEKTYVRKLREILLALKIESALSKDEILELYINKIYLGNRAYGLTAAAQFYYGVTAGELSLAQMAMIAGLPKAPSKYNPLANLERATARRNYVLNRMYNLGMIERDAYQVALAETETARRHVPKIEVEAPYVAEMVRAELVRRYGAEAYVGGYRIFTTIDARLQGAANAALRAGLIEYDMRHGYRKPEAHIDMDSTTGSEDWDRVLKDFSRIAGLTPALVVKLETQTAQVYLSGSGLLDIPWTGLSWARAYLDENQRGPAPKTAADILTVGDVIRVQQLPDGQWRLSQLPAVQGALVALNPHNGAINALVGGFYFYRSSFNRVTQADRQPGSSFKPFVYSAALEKGFTPASIINDAPVVIERADWGNAWRPENYGRKFYGPTRLRAALAHSRNLVSVRILRSLGLDYTIDYATRFGFKRERLPRGLSLALGSSVATPLEMARGFTVFANGGYFIEPRFIKRMEDAHGKPIMETPDQPPLSSPVVEQELVSLESQVQADILAELQEQHSVPAGGQRVISAENAYLMTSMMRDVIRIGTARRALQLGRKDLAGKTGTTNDQRDAWFAGFNRDLVAISWIGFDQHTPLGKDETGGKAALPIWINFMEAALKNVPEQPLTPPPGIVTMPIDADTGLLASQGDPDALSEVFSAQSTPQKGSGSVSSGSTPSSGAAARITEQLF